MLRLSHRIFFIIGSAVIGLFLLAIPSFAADFKADYSVDYTLHPDTAMMHVDQQVTLTNEAPNLRASSYSLTLDHDGYKNVTAHDAGGSLKYTTSKNDDGAPVLTFTFNDHVVGVGNQLKWTISYDSPTLAEHHGQLWDVTIPRVKEHSSYDISSYSVRLHIPQSAGPAAYVTPSPSSQSTDDGNYNYTFTKDQVLPVGIMAAFGQAQVFQFTLKYHLQNPNLGQASTDIALPADVPGYQQILYNKLDPQPVSMHTDSDGNTLATYYLPPRAKMDITFTGWARVSGSHPDLSGTKTAAAIPSDLVKTYTTQQQYWQTTDPELVKKVKELTDPKKPAVDNARTIYQFVTTTLQYNTARINKDLKRMGASAAYRDPKDAVCMEFTDLFVTMARIAGLPAREIDGYAYTTDSANQPIFYPGLGSDILHAWAQVYLPDAGWVMVDPTWGSTTGGVDFFGRIDLNRIAFATKGVSSVTPYAAGSYKTDSKQDGDVNVTFAKALPTVSPAVALGFDQKNVVAGLGSTLPFTVTNTGNVALYQSKLAYTVGQPALLNSNPDAITATILPGQTVTAWLPVGSKSWLDHGPAAFTATLTAQDIAAKPLSTQKQFTLSIQPFFTSVVLPIVILVIGILIVAGGGWFGLHTFYDKRHRPATTIEKQAAKT